MYLTFLLWWYYSTVHCSSILMQSMEQVALCIMLTVCINMCQRPSLHIIDQLYCTVPVPRLYICYLWTYDLYGPVRNTFGAAKSITRASGRGLGPGNGDFFGPCEMSSTLIKFKWLKGEKDGDGTRQPPFFQSKCKTRPRLSQLSLLSVYLPYHLLLSIIN